MDGGRSRDVDSPDEPGQDEIARLDEGRCAEGERGGGEPDEQEADPAVFGRGLDGSGSGLWASGR